MLRVNRKTEEAKSDDIFLQDSHLRFQAEWVDNAAEVVTEEGGRMPGSRKWKRY